MLRFVSPPIDSLDRLRQPLEASERYVFDLLNSYLPQEWEIYVQPHLNGLRPDFVLLHPRKGVVVIEVKDWNHEFWVESRPGKSPCLMIKENGQTISKQKENPVEQVFRYREELRDLYYPRLGHRSPRDIISAVIIFTSIETMRVNSIFAESMNHRGIYNPIVGADTLEECRQKGKITIKTIPQITMRDSSHMNEDVANDLRNWLVEPDFTATQRKPLEDELKEIKLDSTQKRFITTPTKHGYRRIKGPAGSGKSLILAARAAVLSSEAKEVLVITYNITLLNYLQDLAVRYRHIGGKIRENVTWLHFHSWCKRVCMDADFEKEYFDIMGRGEGKTNDEKDLHEKTNELAKLVTSILVDDADGLVDRYDAVLVDEGQDFQPTWWNALRNVCRPGGEMLLVADATQDVYGTAKAWTNEAMIGAGFSGDWAVLKTSYRMPPSGIKIARDFAKQFLDDTADLPEPEYIQSTLFDCKLKWVQTNSANALKVCEEEIFSLCPSADPELIAIADITFLTSNNEFGERLVAQLESKNVKVLHTFGSDAKKRKRWFFMGDGRIKATTIHSFKGWESRALVIYIGHAYDKKALTVTYTALTRLKRSTEGSFLTVVSSAQELCEYGQTWSQFQQRLLD